MYKRKLFYFGLTIAVVTFIALIGTAVSAQITRENLKQSTIAQSLLVEHQQLSSISYRLFKQLTDEVILGRMANQSEVRKKQVLIKQSLNNIRDLETAQRQQLGEEITQGSIEDTDELEQLINKIINEFSSISSSANPAPLNQQDRLRRLLEVTIDDEFREVVNVAVSRQSNVVAAINAKIDTLNTAIVWFTVGLGALLIPFLLYGSYWLFNQLYQPLILIRKATDAIAAGEYQKPISVKLDAEFEELAGSINQLAERLRVHREQQAKYEKELESEVEQRTKELTNANQQLTRIDARRKQFLADVSHELRTPLTIVRGEAQVMLRLESASHLEYQQTLSVILDQSVKLTRLVDDLLLLARTEIDELNLVKSEEAMHAVLLEEVTKWQRKHPERRITLNPHEPASLSTVQIDKPRIQQVISILIDNALKYADNACPINVELSEADNHICIAVKDTGEGISAAAIETIFDRFVRFSKTSEGLGLGLSIAKAIVLAHGGDLKVKSNKGEGSTFTILLPLEQLS